MERYLEFRIDEQTAEIKIEAFLKKNAGLTKRQISQAKFRLDGITKNGIRCRVTETAYPGDVIRVCLEEAQTASAHLENYNFKIGSKTQAGLHCDKASIPVSEASLSLDIVYEDENVIFINKKTGMLSQKSKENDLSLNEYVISYLVNEGKLSIEDLKTFKPSVCNRLDRNTSGLIVAGKSLQGLQDMSKMFKERTLHKYYLAVVVGIINEPMKITGYLKKNNKTNKVTITNKTDGEYIETYYEPVKVLDDVTLLKVQLITGKTHQIRAHLSSINHPIIGDYKYGKKEINDIYKKKYGIENQMLHSYQLTFETINGELGNLSNKTFIAKPPKEFAEITGFRQ